MRSQHNGFQRGFALPTVLIASVILLTVLAVAVSATAAVRTTLKNQYYEQLAQTAGEAGVAYAKACLAENENIPQWTDEYPLTPGTDCYGHPLEAGGVVSALVVAGGGGGGGNCVTCGGGGGGGAGGLTYAASEAIGIGSIPITVGDGGAGGAGGASRTTGVNGEDSSFGSIVTLGGGGGSAQGQASGTGGSGGGGSGGGSPAPSAGGTGTAGQGNNGGTGSSTTSHYGGGGGGGAGGTGVGGATRTGGVGLSYDISGSSVFYAGGGGGGTGSATAGGAGGNGGGGAGVGSATAGTGVAGTANTGGGGGGANGNSKGGAGGAGGSGVVIVRYPTDSLTATGGTITTSGSDTIHTFTSDGDFVVEEAGGVECPANPRCFVTINGNVRSSFSVGRPTLDADGRAVKIPTGGYTEITRTSNGSVWRTYRQPNVQAAVVPDLCSGATSSTLGWQAVVLPDTDLNFAPTNRADVISISTSSIPFGPAFYRKDFTVTSAGTYEASVQPAGSGVPDDAEIYIDGIFVARSDDQSLGTGSIELAAGCHNVVVRFINSHTNLANSAGRFAASVIKEGASIPVAVSDRTWRVTAGDTVNFAHKDFYTASDTWGLVRDIQTAVSINSAWAATSGENGARWINTTHNLSGSNYPAAQYALFRDSRTITVASPTEVRITYNCDNTCSIYLDGSIIANGTYNNVFSSNVTLSEGTHQLGAVLYNSTLSVSGLAIAVTRVSDGTVLTRTDASWLAGMQWRESDTPTYSYDASFSPVPNTEALGEVDALIVGGGGGGGSAIGGGGGGGGVREISEKSVRVGEYPIVVGSGGTVATSLSGGNGGVSSFAGIISLGGGGGGTRITTGSVTQASVGGSGGGGSGTVDGGTGVAGAGAFGTILQGNPGGNGSSGSTAGNSGGGGGAGAAGGNGSGTVSGAGISGTGGNGVASSITGTSVTYGGGGSGGRYGPGSVGAAGTGGGGLGSISGVNAQAGTANTGGGGGGGGGSAALGGVGGSGVVIISYLTDSMTATGGNITTSGEYTIHRFTSSGTFTITSID
jgi:hypothetical protein